MLSDKVSELSFCVAAQVCPNQVSLAQLHSDGLQRSLTQLASIEATHDTRHQVAAIDVPLKLSTIRDFGARACYNPERLMFFTSYVMATYLEEQANKPW